MRSERSRAAFCAAVREARPDLILNAAAYTAVDRAESEPELAMQINGEAPGMLAEEAKKSNALLIHYSTDYVFDGSKHDPWVEDDPFIHSTSTARPSWPESATFSRSAANILSSAPAGFSARTVIIFCAPCCGSDRSAKN